ncbi:MAG: hypothetical protein LBP89_06780 [Helicobacteraceae bacterium]|jgi:tetratricopeptide (TPR) repeat protein|nr:hypothetical protein [Helicobacteraceae bacterium]
MGLNRWLLLSAFSIGAWAQSVSIDVLDATIKDKRVSGATVILQQTGETSLRATTNAQGKATINSPKNIGASAILIVKKEGFSDLVVKCPCDGLTYALSPVMKSLDGLRIVLTWGATPSDLDSHLLYANKHIYFDKKGSGLAYLDVDDISSYGPETITIQKLEPNETYIYTVHNYSGKNAHTDALSKSGAKVFVYAGQSLVKTYNVPQKIAGNVWTVFKIDANGQIIDLNAIDEHIYNGQLPTEYIKRFAEKASGANAAAGVQIASAPIASEAVELNNKGERLYRAGNFQDSISYYQLAVEADPRYAQAYSNMGLSYRKLNLFSESMWANRNAISIASGEDANIVRANSYYEIARLYEQNGAFLDALNYYQLANRENPKQAYDKAIARVKAKL